MDFINNVVENRDGTIITQIGLFSGGGTVFLRNITRRRA